MTSILITGANGQLGNEIKSISRNYPDYEFHFTDVDELDITKIVHIEEFIANTPVSFIINCAAYNAVDFAEKNEEMAYAINSHAVKYLARLAHKHKIFMVHVSTDYVFNGFKNMPYVESDNPEPISVYAKSKRAGELQLLNTLDRGVIVRTSWLYSSHGNNFLKTILKHAREKDELNIVYDQVGTPTYAADLAEVIMKLIDNAGEISDVEIFHYSNEGIASWYDFAKAIIDRAEIKCKLIPVETKDYPLPAHRPFYSVMNKSKIKTFLNIDIPHWQDSLAKCIIKLNKTR